jgi:serine/threonine protein phosphatase 1
MTQHTSTTGWLCKKHYPEAKDPRQPTINGPITIPMNRLNIWNLDTGGGYDGCLTVMDIDSKDFWQAPRTKELYPGEMNHYKK